MSNYLAIATVTAVLHNTLQNVVGPIANASVKTDHPSLHTSTTSPTVNLFLYQVTPSPALRNNDLPTRRSAGELANRPQAALDLNYFFSFYGDASILIPQRLLGRVIAAMHARPVITRKAIRDTLANSIYQYLSGSNLAEAVETVHMIPHPLNIEELSRLWAIFPQVPYALSVAYTASVVLIEEEEFPKPSLPVREYKIYVIPFQRPHIESVEPESGPRDPIVPDSVLIIHGENLISENTAARLGGFEFPVTGRPDQIRVPLADLSADALRAGVQGLQIIHRQLMGKPAIPHTGVDSNLAVLVLHPVITSALYDQATSTLKISVNPPVRAGQRATVLVNCEPGSKFASVQIEVVPDNVDGSSLNIAKPQFSAGNYLVRVQVDGAESQGIRVTVP